MRFSPVALASLAVIVSLAGCASPGATPIAYGTDVCEYCRMTIADKAFGCERITKKGRVYKFDSIECLAAWELDADANATDVHSRWVIDFADPGRFLDLNQAVILVAEHQTSPMGVGLVAVQPGAEATRLMSDLGGRVMSWDETKALVAQRWKIDGER